MFFRLENYERFFFVCLRITLALVFLWFGLLKVFGFNPVYSIVASSYPFFATGAGNLVLGAIETIIGLGLLFKFFPKIIHIALLVHLAGTFFVFLAAPGLMFNPYFPVLTLAGEFVFKNIVLVTAGLVILVHKEKIS